MYVKALEDRVAELEHKMQGLKAITYDADRVQTSPTNRMEELYMALEDAVERNVKKYKKSVGEIEKAFEQVHMMDNPLHIEILTLRYFTDDEDGRQMSLERIACIMHRSFDHVRHLHGRALQEFERIYHGVL